MSNKMDDCCEKCTNFLMIFSIIHSIISIILITTIIAAFYQFMSKKQGDDTISKYTTCSMIIFLTSTILSIATWNLYSVGGDCYNINTSIYLVIELSAGTFFFMQSYLLPVIFFDKVHNIFKNGSFRLKKYTIYSYRTAFTFQIFYILITFILRGLQILSSYMLYVMAIGLFFYFLLVTISLVILFIYKLLQVYKNLNKDEYNEETEFLIEPITKVTILSSISVTMTLINAVFCITYVLYDYSAIVGKFCNYTGTLDVYTNFLCIIFCNKMFKKNYQQICSNLDKRCNNYWKMMVSEDKQIGDVLPPKIKLHMTINSNSVATPKTGRNGNGEN